MTGRRLGSSGDQSQPLEAIREKVLMLSKRSWVALAEFCSGEDFFLHDLNCVQQHCESRHSFCSAMALKAGLQLLFVLEFPSSLLIEG
ncbi:MAG: glycosyl hydrolase [Prochlorococcus sp. MED-G132]|nr:MAG: glycosyl hydrolase [Prochlorococcus sp. MED-G132]